MDDENKKLQEKWEREREEKERAREKKRQEREKEKDKRRKELELERVKRREKVRMEKDIPELIQVREEKIPELQEEEKKKRQEEGQQQWKEKEREREKKRLEKEKEKERRKQQRESERAKRKEKAKKWRLEEHIAEPIRAREEKNPEFHQVARRYIGPVQWLYAKDEATDETMAFCWIQKAGCTHFKEVHKRLCSVKDYLDRAPLVHKRSIVKNASRLIVDKSVHKYVFYRDPMERFLSGYLDKCEGKSRSYCRMVFQAEWLPFPEAVFKLLDMDPFKMDGHFRPQSTHCGGLNRIIVEQTFTHVARLQNEETTRQEMKYMIQHTFQDVTDEEFDRIYPARKMAAHATDANEKLKRFYSDPQLVGIVVNFFLEDYLAFDFLPHEFAQEALLDLRARQDPYAVEDEKLLKLGMELPDIGPVSMSTNTMEAVIQTDYTFSSGLGIIMADASPLRVSKNSQPAAVYYLLFALLVKLLL